MLRYKWIDDIICGLIDRYDTNNVYEICEGENIKIVKLDPENILLDKKVAYYYRDIEDNEVIFIRNNLHPNIEQFILKHELGHALLHPAILSAPYTLSNVGRLERQANYFALKLSNLNFDKVELEGMTLEQISKYFKIPHQPLRELF
jgi:Zn-dependent peptidase ImmA (M78 family)